MSTQTLLTLIYIIGGCFVIIVAIYFFLAKKMQKSDYQKIKKLREGTKRSDFSMEILYQKLYITYAKIPYIKSKAFKLRRRLEIIDVDDEYSIRKDTAKILTKVLLILLPIVTLSIIFTHSNYLLMWIILIFEMFMADAFIDGSVDKMDNNLLKRPYFHLLAELLNLDKF